MPGTATAAASRGNHAAQSRRRSEDRPGDGAPCLWHRADLRITEDRRSRPRTSFSREPGAAGGWAADHHTGKVVVRRPLRFSGPSLIITRVRAHNSRPGRHSSGGPQDHPRCLTRNASRRTLIVIRLDGLLESSVEYGKGLNRSLSKGALVEDSSWSIYRCSRRLRSSMAQT